MEILTRHDMRSAISSQTPFRSHTPWGLWTAVPDCDVPSSGCMSNRSKNPLESVESGDEGDDEGVLHSTSSRPNTGLSAMICAVST
jgi:hypothetical protein